MDKPQTQYTRSGRISIAYQVYGDGPLDLVYIPGWVSNIDLMWDCPPLVDFLEGLSKIARIILFDKRGTGLSDRVTELSPIEDRMDDIRAVMDAVGSEKAVLFGHSEGGSVSALFSATYPERTVALITFGVFAKRRWSEDYPWAPTDTQRQLVYDMIEQDWGSGNMDLVSLAPSMAEDEQFMDWLARYFRSGASPSAALALTRMNTEVDIIDILPTINVPALFMCRTNDIDVKVEESKFMASKISTAEVVEFEGDDHLFWAGNAAEVLAEIKRFLDVPVATPDYEKKLATILVIQIDNPLKYISDLGDHAWMEKKKSFQSVVQKVIDQYRGKIVLNSGNAMTAVFDGPGKGAQCAIALRNIVQSLSIGVKQGLHLGECIFSLVDDEVTGIALQLAKMVAEKAETDRILLTQTVGNLLSGTGLNIYAQGTLTIDAIGQNLGLFSVEDVIEYEQEPLETVLEKLPQKNHSFLEDVLESIENHMNDLGYDLDTLCQEVGVSQRQLQRKLKIITNKSPNQLIRSVRLHNARKIIVEEKENVSQAAYRSGFNSQSYFAKCFKTEFGMAPSQLAR